MTEYARDRLRHAGDPTITRFADVFHQRMLLLLHRAWARTQPTVAMDRPAADTFALYVGALMGLGLQATRRRNGPDDHPWLHYAAGSGHRPATPTGCATSSRTASGCPPPSRSSSAHGSTSRRTRAGRSGSRAIPAPWDVRRCSAPAPGPGPTGSASSSAPCDRRFRAHAPGSPESTARRARAALHERRVGLRAAPRSRAFGRGAHAPWRARATGVDDADRARPPPSKSILAVDPVAGTTPSHLEAASPLPRSIPLKLSRGIQTPMADISRAALFGKLDEIGYRALESATVFCKMRGNPYVELAHWVASGLAAIRLRLAQDHAPLRPRRLARGPRPDRSARSAPPWRDVGQRPLGSHRRGRRAGLALREPQICP